MSSAASNSPRTRRPLRLAMQWSIPLIIIVAFVLTGHLGEALSALTEVSLGWAGLLVLVGVALPLSHAWRWCYLLKRTGESLPVAASARITSLASLLNYAAPGFLGAPAKAIFARDSHRVPISRSLPTLAMEQVLDAAALAVAGGLALVLTGPVVLGAVDGMASLQHLLWWLAGVIVVIVAAVGAWFLVRRLLPTFVDALREASISLLRSREHFRPIAALTVTRWILDMVAVGIASIAVGLRLSIVDVLLIANLSLLIGLVAPVPGGLGVREAVMAAIAGVIGVSIPAILALSVLHRAALAIGLPIVLGGSRMLERSGQ